VADVMLFKCCGSSAENSPPLAVRRAVKTLVICPATPPPCQLCPGTVDRVQMSNTTHLNGYGNSINAVFNPDHSLFHCSLQRVRLSDCAGAERYAYIAASTAHKNAQLPEKARAGFGRAAKAPGYDSAGLGHH
jgi:hypothetical protein